MIRAYENHWFTSHEAMNCLLMFVAWMELSKPMLQKIGTPSSSRVIQPLIGNPYNGYINPYYWVDDHPLLYGNNGRTFFFWGVILGGIIFFILGCVLFRNINSQNTKNNSQNISVPFVGRDTIDLDQGWVWLIYLWYLHGILWVKTIRKDH